MDIKERLIKIGKTIVAYTMLVIFFLFCWFILGIRDTTLMIVIFFSLVFVVAVVMVVFQERAKKGKSKKPELSLFGSIESIENRLSIQTPSLCIYGEVRNKGGSTAFDCKLKVVAYQEKIKAIDAEISLGSIDSGRKKSVDETIYYNGESLTQCIMWAEWKEKTVLLLLKKKGIKTYVGANSLASTRLG